MKLPLELSTCTVDLEEVAVMKYSATDRRTAFVTKEQFKCLDLRHKRLLVTLRSGRVLDLREGDADVFASVYGKKVQGEISIWRHRHEATVGTE